MVSKNPGGTKRVTSLADNLKLNFALVTTQPKRITTHNNSMEGSMFFETYGPPPNLTTSFDGPSDVKPASLLERRKSARHSSQSNAQANGINPTSHPRNISSPYQPSPLTHTQRTESTSPPDVRTPTPRTAPTFSSEPTFHSEEAEVNEGDEYTDERASEVVTGRLIQGHIVDDDAPSPSLSAMSSSGIGMPRDGFFSPRNGLASPAIEEADPMMMSSMSSLSRRTTDLDQGGGSEDEEEGFKDPIQEHLVTLVGNVQDRVVLIVDDIIDQCGSWIAAAETVAKRGDAKEVYCIATHGLFGEDSLERMEACECIDHIVVSNTYPLDPERARACRKLIVLDISYLLAEAIRRNHYGESISALFQQYPD